MGGDCDLVLANRRPVEAPSDLVSANRDAAESPSGNSRRVPEPCASSALRAGEADRDTERGGKQTTRASHGRFHGINFSSTTLNVIIYSTVCCVYTMT